MQQLGLIIPHAKHWDFPRVVFPAGQLRFPNQAVVTLDLLQAGECLEVEETQVIFTLETLTDMEYSLGEWQSYRSTAELVAIYSPGGQRWLFSCFGFSLVKEVETEGQNLVEMTLPQGTQQIRIQKRAGENGSVESFADLQGNMVD